MNRPLNHPPSVRGTPCRHARADVRCGWFPNQEQWGQHATHHPIGQAVTMAEQRRDTHKQRIDVHAEPLSALRKRTSEKWTVYPDDVLPLFVAEMDYPLADPIVRTLVDRVRASDTGYVGSPGPLAGAFAAFAASTWDWTVEPERVRTTTDVSVAIVETLRLAIRPGDRVVITPPVYPPFFDLVPEAGGVVVEVPLLNDGPSASPGAAARAGSAADRGSAADQGRSVDGAGAWSLDLEALEAAFASGVRAFLLCNPHNPLGLVHSREQLAALARIAAKYGVMVVSDEIHGPLTHSGVDFVPFLTVSDEAREWGVAVTSASKTWNLAGTKCALIVAGSATTDAMLARLPEEVGFRTSLLGLHASVAAFTEGEPWRQGTLHALQTSRDLLTALLAEHLPEVRFRAPSASYLAWLDFRELGWGDDPAAHALEKARVALNRGLDFGTQGAGFARLNFACSPEVLTEAVTRLAAAR
jgi:cystathionine beta-lyase